MKNIKFILMLACAIIIPFLLTTTLLAYTPIFQILSIIFSVFGLILFPALGIFLIIYFIKISEVGLFGKIMCILAVVLIGSQIAGWISLKIEVIMKSGRYILDYFNL